MFIEIEEVTKTVTKKEVQIPYYSKSETKGSFYKIYGESVWDAMEVYSKNDVYKIGFVNSGSAFTNTMPCTKEEFDLAFEEVQKKLNDLKNK